MNTRFRTTFWLWTAVVAALIGTRAWAQPPSSDDVLEPESPAVLAILETNPSTPAEYARAASILAGLQRPKLAKDFLRRLIAAKLTQPQFVRLAEQCDMSMFTGMASRKELLPEGKQVADAILRAVNRKLQDPERIARLIEQLGDPSINVRAAALGDLGKAGAAAVGPLAAVLANPARSAEHPNVRAVLVRMGSQAVGPLLAILDEADPPLTIQAILMLREMKARDVSIYLLKPYASAASDPRVRAAAGAALTRLVGRAPTQREAARLLADRAKDYFDRRRPVDGVVDGMVDGNVETWSWDAGKHQCTSKSVSAARAARTLAARLAREAHALDPDDPPTRLLYLTTLLEAAVYENGLGKPLKQDKGTPLAEAAARGIAVIEEVLEHAMAGGHPAAATAAAHILGEIGTAEALLHRGARPTPLVRAARHADRRLRIAALEAIVRLQPAGRFPGSSYVSQSLGFFAASGGTRKALVAGPITKVSHKLAGMLAGMGYAVDTATTGRTVLRLATSSADYELALIDVAIDRSPASLLLQQLHHDYRSADLRVGLIARSGYLDRAQRIADGDPLTMAFSRPYDTESAAWQLERLATLAPDQFVDHAERQRQAGEALGHLANLSESSGEVYDVFRLQEPILTALYAPKLSTKATAVVGNIATPESQRALVELSSRFTQPLEARTAAVEALRRNIEKSGILLDSSEIVRQYDRYNQSKNLDASTQRILGLILDCIEAPTQAVKRSGR